MKTSDSEHSALRNEVLWVIVLAWMTGGGSRMLVVSKLVWLIFSSFAADRALAKQANSQQYGVLPVRNYSHSAWTDIFYRPKQTRVDGLGLVNEDEVYLTSSNLVSELLRTPAIDLLPIKGVDDGKMVASVLCHHRQSIFFEVQKADHSTVTIFELDILHRPTDAKEVLPFHDAEEAVALSCLDHYLLRASKSEVSFIDLKRGVSGKLIEYDDGEHDARFISSLSVRYAADRAERAEIFAVLPQIQSLARLTLHFDVSPCNGCDRIELSGLNRTRRFLQFPNAVVLNAVVRRNTQIWANLSANVRKRAQMQVRKRAQKSGKGRKRAQKSA